jgi:hypothetical protein
MKKLANQRMIESYKDLMQVKGYFIFKDLGYYKNS